MPITTRSMRPFEHDVRVVSRCLRKMHSGFVMRKGVVTELRLNRPNTYEADSLIRMPLYGDITERQRLHRGLASGSLLRVTAFHAKLQTSYDRGVFKVVRSTPNFVHLERETRAEAPAGLKDASKGGKGNKDNTGKRVITLTVDSAVPSKKLKEIDAALIAPLVPLVPLAPLKPVPAAVSASATEELYFFKPGELFQARAVKSAKSTAPIPPLVTAAPVSLVSRTYSRPVTTLSGSVPAAVPPKRQGDDDETASTASSTTSSSRSSGYASSKRSSIPAAIKTVFSGVEYRSRLEANFARLLSALNIRFVYEPVKYNQQRGSTYTIDFFLPAQQLYVELKPKRPHVEEERKCEEMSRSGFRVALLYGSSPFKLPFRSEYFMGRSHRDYAHHDALRGMAWMDGVKLPGDTVFVVGNNPASPCPLDAGDQVHLGQVASTHDTRWGHATIAEAMRALQRAAFDGAH